MENNIKFSNGGGFKYFLGKEYYINSGSPLSFSYTSPYDNYWLLLNTYEYSNKNQSSRASLKINGTTIDRLVATDGSDDGTGTWASYIKNGCFVSKASKGDVCSFTMTFTYNMNYNFVFTVNKPNLIGSLAKPSSLTTTTLTSNKDLLIFVEGNGTEYSISNAEYSVVYTQNYLKMIYIPKTSSEITFTITSTGVMNIFEI